jgi:hypothetical protein
LGEGIIRPIPPDLSSCGVTCIDWDGEVRCRSDVTVGGFNLADVQVKVGPFFSMTFQSLQYMNAPLCRTLSFYPSPHQHHHLP